MESILPELIEEARIKIFQELLASGGKGYNQAVFRYMETSFRAGMEYEKHSEESKPR